MTSIKTNFSIVTVPMPYKAGLGYKATQAVAVTTLR